jgi:drug/metabolite transporter (DMT)-like permease
LLLSEVLTPLQWFGVSLTLVSIYLINQREEIPVKMRSALAWASSRNTFGNAGSSMTKEL